ncbi:acetylornithine aminotransferase [Tulasnella sp. 419]|nr:acetylornithine aminotransferase [Tulasnella sp. 419]
MRGAVQVSKRLNLLRSRATSSSYLSRSQSTAAGPSTRYLDVTHPEDADSVPQETKDRLASLTKHVVDTYARPPLIIARGEGPWVYTTTNQKYLDFSAGIAVNSLGHGDKLFSQTMKEQADTIIHSSNIYHNEWAGQLASLLVELTKRDGGLGWAPGSSKTADEIGAKVFFSNSGTEANEAAFKFARKIAKESWARQVGPGEVGSKEGAATRDWQDSPKINFVCFENGFHGRSMGALSATTNPKYQRPFEPLIPGFSVGQLNDIEGMRQLITEDTCGVIIEPIQGEGGLGTCTVEFLRALRKRCDEVGAVLIYDEIQCGLYRSGALWAHSTLPTDCHPDIITMAKPLANGIPIGAVIVKESLTPAITVGSHGTTFGGSPFATRMGHHTLSRLSQPEFVSHVKEVSSHLQNRLSTLPSTFPDLLQPEGIRGRGLILGLPFRNPDHPGRLVKMARERGVLLLTAGKDAVRLIPSLIVTKEQVNLAVDVMESCLWILSKEEAAVKEEEKQ